MVFYAAFNNISVISGNSSHYSCLPGLVWERVKRTSNMILFCKFHRNQYKRLLLLHSYAKIAFLTHYHIMLHFDAVKIYRCRAVENIVRKEIACNKLFVLSFLTMSSTIYGSYFHFKCTLKCRLQIAFIWTNLKLCRLEMG